MLRKTIQLVNIMRTQRRYAASPGTSTGRKNSIEPSIGGILSRVSSSSVSS